MRFAPEDASAPTAAARSTARALARRPVRLIGGLLLGATVLAACTSDGSDGDDSSSSRCGFADAAVVTAAFGGSVTAESASTSGTGSHLCSFTIDATNLGYPGVIALTRVPSASADGFAQVKAAHPDAAPVAGVGDDAFYLPSATQLQFRKGDQVVIIDAMVGVPAGPTPDPAATQADAVTLATAIAATL